MPDSADAGGGALDRPLLVVVSAPSGAGKSTLCNRLLADDPKLVYSVSCTTRAPRGAEQNGVHYHFLGVDDFLERAAAGDFLEYALVHGNYYGTLAATVAEAMRAGKSVLMDIDVQGADQIRQAIAQRSDRDLLKRGFVDIFIAPPSMDELAARLNGRGEDAPEVIACRLRNAEVEMAAASRYRYTVVNDVLEKALSRLEEVLAVEHHSARRAVFEEEASV